MARLIACAGFLLLLLAAPARGQDLEPRRWTHLPNDLHVVGVGIGATQGDVLFDPVLQIEDAEMELATLGLGYVHSFDFHGKSARLDVSLPYSTGRWSGLLEGQPASTRRRGFLDPRVRLSVLLYGGEAMDAKTFAETERSDTVIGAALSFNIPLGDYRGDRLINLSQNRWVIRPQAGITHQRGKWTFELTGSVFFYDSNDDFFGESVLENDPLWAAQVHAIYSFRPGVWAAIGFAHGTGADATVDGEAKDSQVENQLLSISAGFPLPGRQSLKFSWLNSETQIRQGSKLDTLAVAWSFFY